MKAQVKSKLNLQDRVELQKVIPLETPYLLYLDPSSVCNFHCRFCPSGHKKLVDEADYTRSVMSFSLFKKAIDSLEEFSEPIKVLRMNKIGEPLLNKNIAQMVAYAKKSGRVQYIDFASNASLLNEKTAIALIDAGLDRLNISIEGVNSAQYKEMCNVDMDFDALVEKIKWLYSHRKKCEITVKIPKNYLSKTQENEFYELFGDYCDRIYVENLSPIWPEFDMTEFAGVAPNEESQYGQPLEEKLVCSYIFYAMAINADGTVSACCPDWAQKLLVGDLTTMSVKEVWNSDAFNDLRLLHLNGKRFDNSTCGACGHIKYSQVDNIDRYREEILQNIQGE